MTNQTMVFVVETMVFVTEKMVFATEKIVFVTEKIVFVSEKIVFVSEKIVFVSEKIVSKLENLFLRQRPLSRLHGKWCRSRRARFRSSFKVLPLGSSRSSNYRTEFWQLGSDSPILQKRKSTTAIRQY